MQATHLTRPDSSRLRRWTPRKFRTSIPPSSGLECSLRSSGYCMALVVLMGLNLDCPKEVKKWRMVVPNPLKTSGR